MRKKLLCILICLCLMLSLTACRTGSGQAQKEDNQPAESDQLETEGDMFFDSGTAVMVPVDGTDMYYYPEDASNFDESESHGSKISYSGKY